MIYVLGGGGGSGGSELVIVGGTTSPEKAAQNTVWIETDVAITNYVLSATEPANPVEGMALVIIGTASSIKLTSPVGGDWITVYPLSAKQYVNGTWVDKTAKSYQNGAWVDWWNGELYDTGNEYEAFTGGWTATTINSSTTVTKDATSMTIKTDYGDDALHCSNKMDLTDFSKLVVTGKSFRNNSSAERREGNTKICVWSAIGSSVSNNQVAYANYPAADYDGEFELDVSGLTGEYYVGVFAGRYYSVTVRKVKLS